MTACPALATAAVHPVARRRVALVALLTAALAAPALLAAQITTGLTPPLPPPSDSQIAAAESVVTFTRDSIAHAERLSMQAWVDSAARSLERGGAAVQPLPEAPGDTLLPAAGTPPTPPVPASPPAAGSPASPPAPVTRPAPTVPPDSTRVPPDSTRATPPPPDRAGDGGGVTPPDTASPLPLLALAGVALSGLGLGLLRRR